jgi:hypothetical protein
MVSSFEAPRELLSQGRVRVILGAVTLDARLADSA